MCLPKRRNENNIRIMDNGDEERCTICGGQFKHSKRYMLFQNNDGLREIVFKTAHNGCLKIMARIKQRQQEITDLEWEIWKMRVAVNGR